MVYENNIPKTETIYELKNEVPSFEEFMQSYEMDERVNANYDLESKDRALHGPQYGPGNEKKNKGKKKTSGSGTEYNEQHLISALNNKWGERDDWWEVDESADKKGDWHALSLETSAGASAGAGGIIASGGITGSGIRYSDHIGDIRFGSGSLGGEAGIGAGGATLGYSANLDVAIFTH